MCRGVSSTMLRVLSVSFRLRAKFSANTLQPADPTIKTPANPIAPAAKANTIAETAKGKVIPTNM